MIASPLAPFVSRILIGVGSIGLLGVLRQYPLQPRGETKDRSKETGREKLTVGFLPVT